MCVANSRDYQRYFTLILFRKYMKKLFGHVLPCQIMRILECFCLILLFFTVCLLLHASCCQLALETIFITGRTTTVNVAMQASWITFSVRNRRKYGYKPRRSSLTSLWDFSPSTLSCLSISFDLSAALRSDVLIIHPIVAFDRPVSM